MKIKVYIKNLIENHVMYMNDKKRNNVILDAKDTDFKADRFKFKVMDMIIGWPQKLTESNMLDGCEYKIVINDDGKETIFCFQNKFPEDVYRIEELFSLVSAEVKNV